MRKLTLTLSAAVLAFAGSAHAQAPDGPRHDPMTRAEVQAQAEQAFARLDGNHDGVLNQDDRKSRDADRFARLDQNGDGALSREEFDAAPKRPDGKRGGPRFGARGEGKEGMPPPGVGMRRGPGGPGPMGPMGAGIMLRQADDDGDGAISQAEFSAAALERFDRADANRDGTVTPDERKAAREAMRGGRDGPARPQP